MNPGCLLLFFISTIKLLLVLLKFIIYVVVCIIFLLYFFSLFYLLSFFIYDYFDLIPQYLKSRTQKHAAETENIREKVLSRNLKNARLIVLVCLGEIWLTGGCMCLLERKALEVSLPFLCNGLSSGLFEMACGRNLTVAQLGCVNMPGLDGFSSKGVSESHKDSIF